MKKETSVVFAVVSKRLDFHDFFQKKGCVLSFGKTFLMLLLSNKMSGLLIGQRRVLNFGESI